MQKIFVITAECEIENKPVWFDEFRRKYDEPYHCHLTLKQPCFIDEQEVETLKNILKSFLSVHQDELAGLFVDFTQLTIHTDEEGTCLMLNDPDARILRKFQKDLCDFLSSYRDYYKPKYESYEVNFEPHITIARDLSETAKVAALRELPKDTKIRAKITQIVLTVVSNFGPEEARDPQNRSIYKCG